MTPDVMEILIRTQGGEVSYHVPVMKVKTYSIEETFEKKPLFLIPFYILTYEGKFKEIDADEGKLAELKAEYEDIKIRLEQLAADGLIDEFYKKTIMDMAERVLANLAVGYENILKGVGSVMSGQVLDYEAKRIKNEGREEGIIDTLTSLVKDGILTVKDAAARAGITEVAFQQKMTAK